MAVISIRPEFPCSQRSKDLYINTTLNIQCVLSRITDFMVDDNPVQRNKSEHRSYRSDTNPEEHEVKMLNMG